MNALPAPTTPTLSDDLVVVPSAAPAPPWQPGTAGAGRAPIPLDVLLLSPGLPHDGRTITQRSLGGSETAAINVSAALAARGHRVIVCAAGCQGEQIDGVMWMPIEQFGPICTGTPHDVTIVSRSIDALRLQAASSIQIFWCHDLALRRAAQMLGSGAWGTDRFYVMSEFQKRQYLEVNKGLPEDLFYVTRNGVDLRNFYSIRALPRNKNVLLYGSRPERGLDTALNIMAVLHKLGSPLELHVAFYDNMVPELRPLYESLFQRANSMPNVKILGPLLQKDWQVRIAQAGMLLYPGCPGDFREISCINAMEAMAAGTPVVTANKGALPETCGAGAALYVGREDSDPGDPEYVDNFARAVKALSENPELWEAMHQAALRRGDALDWADVAADWEHHWYQLFDARTDNEWRIRRHYERLGDHEALRILGYDPTTSADAVDPADPEDSGPAVQLPGSGADAPGDRSARVGLQDARPSE